jgi:putative transposase
MPNYRRVWIEGGCYFFTATLNRRQNTVSLVQYIELLRGAVQRVRSKHPFSIDACVVLPDHVHAIWTLPAGDKDFSTRWRLIKMAFTRGLPPLEGLPPSRISRGERGAWQQRFWEHAIRSEADYAAHMDYIHANPVKHGLAAEPAGWPHSTFRSAVARGLYPASWLGEHADDLPVGEPSSLPEAP